ncbi:MAG: MSHA biogenesis protein MshM [Flavobacteriales bacterium]|jgi:MSHA biogenesis protein MshM
MYTDFFGLHEKPFSLTPDTSLFLNEQSHRDALNTMLLALKHCEGFIKVVGEVGTGKTLLGRILLSRLGYDFLSVYIPNPFMTAEELKYYVAKEVGADIEKAMASHEVLSALYRRLVQHARNGKHVVLIVDEAQAMPRDTIECLRLLTNLETEKRKLLQIVMLGQPELDHVLNRTDLRQLKQRIVFSEYLKPFSLGGARRYVVHRIKSTQKNSKEIFTPSALTLVAIASGGIPRLINILCHKSLICAYGRGNMKVGLWHVSKAILDTDGSRLSSRLVSMILRLTLFKPRTEHAL